jgi:glycine/D-amino acid oxidase-like deaminating enzyme/nitrite reductase/ring-hydroxylating ferredoxin subunit
MSRVGVLVASFSGKSESFWVATLAEGALEHPPLGADTAVDVAIVGGGIVGLTAAALLQRAGKRTAVIEARRIGQQVTGRSTAKITSQHGLIYQQLEKSFDENTARAYGAANQAGLERIVRFVEELGIDCALERKSAYVYSRTGEQLSDVEKEAELARSLGLPASLVRETSLPFPVAGAVRFDDQAQFNPCRYALGLARAILDGGGQIFEGTRALSIEHGEPCRVTTGRGIVTARDVIEATHLPLGKEGMFFAKAYPYAHPMVAARIDPVRAPDGMFISAAEPTHSIRTAKREDEIWLVAVGNSYKPGHPDDEMEAFEDLTAFLRDEFGVGSIDYRWTNEDYESMDGLPFIGRATSSAAHLFVATGFNAWGISNGTVAGMILSDLIAGRSNPWAEIFDATRVKPLAGGASFVTENLGTGAQLVGGYVRGRPSSTDDLQPGEAAVLKLDGKRYAVFKDEQGNVHAVSAACTHLGCILGWNPVDRTWDCSCHGSRFAIDGRVIHGPATADLDRRGV